MSRLFLKCYSDDENYDAECSLVPVEITKGLLNTIKARWAEVKRIVAKAGKKSEGIASLAHVTWWDYHASYITGLNGYDEDHITELFGEAAYKAIEGQNVYIEPESFAPPQFEELRTEIEQMVIDATDLWWEATPKHGNIRLTTACVRIEDFLKIIESK